MESLGCPSYHFYNACTTNTSQEHKKHAKCCSDIMWANRTLLWISNNQGGNIRKTFLATLKTFSSFLFPPHILAKLSICSCFYPGRAAACANYLRLIFVSSCLFASTQQTGFPLPLPFCKDAKVLLLTFQDAKQHCIGDGRREPRYARSDNKNAFIVIGI